MFLLRIVPILVSHSLAFPTDSKALYSSDRFSPGLYKLSPFGLPLLTASLSPRETDNSWASSQTSEPLWERGPASCVLIDYVGKLVSSLSLC